MSERRRRPKDGPVQCRPQARPWPRGHGRLRRGNQGDARRVGRGRQQSAGDDLRDASGCAIALHVADLGGSKADLRAIWPAKRDPVLKDGIMVSAIIACASIGAIVSGNPLGAIAGAVVGFFLGRWISKPSTY